MQISKDIMVFIVVFFFFFTVVHLFVKAQFGGCHCDKRITVNLLCCNRHGTEDKQQCCFGITDMHVICVLVSLKPTGDSKPPGLFGYHRLAWRSDALFCQLFL